MATIDHVELDALHAGMPVAVAGTTIGGLEEVIPQPDGKHPMRLIVRVDPGGRRVSVPIDWVRGIRNGVLELWVDRNELEQLPEYVPPIPVGEARERVQQALQSKPGTAGVQVAERNGTLELHGTVADRAARLTASRVAQGVPGVGPVRNRLATRAELELATVGYGYPWLQSLLERAAGLEFDQEQLEHVEDMAERSLVDLFDVAEDTAAANGRGRVLRHDLPLTKGLQLALLEVVEIAREFELEPLLVFLADAGIRTPMDEGLRSEAPRLMAALLIVIARLTRIIESEDHTFDRVEAVLDLTL